MRRLRVMLLIALFVQTTVSVPAPSVFAQDDRLQAAVSTPLLADIVRNVTSDRADVFAVMPENADPHTWEVSPQDIVRATGADTFISVGANLEPFVESGGWQRGVSDAGVTELWLTDHVDLIEVDKVIDHGDHVHDLRRRSAHLARSHQGDRRAPGHWRASLGTRSGQCRRVRPEP